MNVKYFSMALKEASGDDGPTSSYVPSLSGHPVVQPFPEHLRVRASLEGSLGTSDPRLQPPHSALLRVRNFILSRHPLDGVSHSARRSEPLRLVLAVDQLRPLNHDRPGQMLYGSNADSRQRLRSFKAQNERMSALGLTSSSPFLPYAHRSTSLKVERRPAPWAAKSEPL